MKKLITIIGFLALSVTMCVPANAVELSTLREIPKRIPSKQQKYWDSEVINFFIVNGYICSHSDKVSWRITKKSHNRVAYVECNNQYNHRLEFINTRTILTQF